MDLTKEWSEFKGDYQKKLQDIKLKDGSVILKCWPNAGVFVCFSDSSQKDIPLKDVKYTRLSR